MLTRSFTLASLVGLLLTGGLAAGSAAAESCCVPNAACCGPGAECCASARPTPSPTCPVTGLERRDCCPTKASPQPPCCQKGCDTRVPLPR